MEAVMMKDEMLDLLSKFKCTFFSDITNFRKVFFLSFSSEKVSWVSALLNKIKLAFFSDITNFRKVGWGFHPNSMKNYQFICSKFNNKKSFAFTLAEVLITLGIIGIVACMTIPTLVKNTNDMQYKVAYKKAYADISQAFEQSIVEHSLYRPSQFNIDATTLEWNTLKSAFKVTKDCPKEKLYECWVNADTIYTGYPSQDSSMGFIDASGRSWAQYSSWENIYFVDTNGAKGPNHFGKDRWAFSLQNADGGTKVNVGYPTKVGVWFSSDRGSGPDCHYPPCYYRSWLFN